MFLKKCGNNKRGIFFPQFGFQKLVIKSEAFIDLLEKENGGKGGGMVLGQEEMHYTVQN